MARAPVLVLQPPIPTEREEQALFFDLIDRHLYLYPDFAKVYHCPNGASLSAFYYTSVSGKRVRVCPEGWQMRSQGVRKGVADLGWDVARGGFFGWRCELKRLKEGRLSEEQKEWAQWYESQNYAWRCCKGAMQAWEFLLWYYAQPPTQTLQSKPLIPSSRVKPFDTIPSKTTGP